MKTLQQVKEMYKSDTIDSREAAILKAIELCQNKKS